ncbi:V-set domain-containing T-cell activation inhibitor 1-like isoform X2 [Erpetoichthys calabaricus]|uniref:V-set domain-containing T-cell activation inhibitor 1-like isoform X2 n=1 Tax=Erpetoichthys calabaricus TaxID=27687 RepID=UPI0022342D92|nr:V-set domain-containing T-cell activation inhibitor 1-like isoform X2 [Erpetoichthys calabaricus]
MKFTGKHVASQQNVIRDSGLLKLKIAELVKVNSGEDVLLPCNFPCIEDVLLKVLTIEWLFQSNDTSHVVYFYDLSTNQTKINPIYQDRMQTFHRQSSCGNASLLFRDVYLNDTGTFTCNVFTHWSRGAGKLQLLVLSGDSGMTDSPTAETRQKPTGQERTRWWSWVFSLALVIIFAICVGIYKCNTRANENEERLLQVAH